MSAAFIPEPSSNSKPIKLKPLRVIPIIGSLETEQVVELKEARHVIRNTSFSPLSHKSHDSNFSSLAKRLSKLELERRDILASNQAKDQEIFRL
jgi:hypothetical protein